jgi:hypothetical protein
VGAWSNERAEIVSDRLEERDFKTICGLWSQRKHEGPPAPSLGWAPGRSATDEVRGDRQPDDDQEEVQDRSPATRKGEGRRSHPPARMKKNVNRPAATHRPVAMADRMLQPTALTSRS